MQLDQIAGQKRKDAMNARVRIAVLEGVVLMLVIAAFVMTGSIPALLAGVAVSAAVFAPMFLRWMKEHGPALKAVSHSTNEGQG